MTQTLEPDLKSRFRPVLERDTAIYAGCAAFAAVVTQTGMPNHRVWAWWALCAYLTATVVLLVRRERPAFGGHALVGLVTVGALVCPLVQLTSTGQAQNEVAVVFDAARRLLDGQPLYPVGADLADAVARSGVDAYFPYLPAMAVLGVPAVLADRAGLGPVAADPRLTFALLYTAAVLVVARRTGDRSPGPWVVLVASPLAALPLSAGGADLPVVGALLVALVLSRDDRPVAAGLVAGLACAAKLTAWPLVVVLAVLHLHRRGRGAAFASAGSAVGVVAAFVLPVLGTSASGLLVHDVRFPAGLEPVPSPAASPFPGHLIAQHVPDGRVLTLLLLGAAVAAMVVLLLRCPPRTVHQAALHYALGLGLATALAPATRVGYLVYPLAVLVVGWALRENRVRPRGEMSATDAGRPDQ
jgi:hypothetical protein